MVTVQDGAVFSILLGLYVWLYTLNRSLDFDFNDVWLVGKLYFPLPLQFCSMGLTQKQMPKSEIDFFQSAYFGNFSAAKRMD